MSAIYFHTLDCETVSVSGAERAHMQCVLSDIALSIVGTITYERIMNVLPTSCYLHSMSDNTHFEKHAETWLHVSNDKLILNGEKHDIFPVLLNTAYKLGSGPVKIAARIHGQCEIHCYIRNENKQWFAGIVESGLSCGLFRLSMGWRDVLDLLAQTKSDIVLSYSVTEQFPNYWISDWYGLPEFVSDDFYERDYDAQWESCMAVLGKDKHLEIKPEGFDDYYFDTGLSIIDFIAV